jgi:ferredoxin
MVVTVSGGEINGGWVVAADRDRCIGSGSCAFAVPDVFDVDAGGRVVLVGAVVAGDERVRDAVENCPVDALRLIEAGRP